MDFKESIGQVEESKEYKSFIKKNPHYYLVHAFIIVEDGNSGNWQIGYYSKDTDKIVIFEPSGGIILVHPEEEALKKEEYIQRLEIEKIKIKHNEALSITSDLMTENYKYDLASKYIILLQSLPEFGQIWNVTVITANFSVINVKIDAVSGDVVKHEKQNLMQWNSKG